MMNRLFKAKRKKAPKPPQQPVPPVDPTGIAGPQPNSQELDVTSDGGPNLSNEGLGADRGTDLPVSRNEGAEMGSRMLFRGRKDGDQELPTSESSTSEVAIGYENQLASKCS